MFLRHGRPEAANLSRQLTPWIIFGVRQVRRYPRFLILKTQKLIPMEVVIRNYSGKGATEMFRELEKRKAELEPVMRSVPGFVSYTLANSSSGGFSVTICEDQAGIDESTRKAKDWIAKNAGHIRADAPSLSVGKVIVHTE
jgi:hypothetical protein